MPLVDYLKNHDIGVETIFPHNPALAHYIHLERGEDATPILAFKPTSAAQIQTILQLLNKHNTSAVIFAGNTGLVSAQRAQNQVVIDVNGLNKMLSITLENGTTHHFSSPPTTFNNLQKADFWQAELQHWLTDHGFNTATCHHATVSCQAGMSVGSLNHILQAAHIEVPINTGAITLGAGMSVGAGAANASHGSYGLMHGTMADLTTQVHSINGNGTTRVDLNPPKPIIIDETRTAINSAAASYGDSALGTQGTFALITHLSLRTSPIPVDQHLYLIKVHTMQQANDIRKQLHAAYPQHLRQCELINQHAANLVQIYEPNAFINPFYTKHGAPEGGSTPINSPFIIMVELIAGHHTPAEERALIYYDFLTTTLNIPAHNIAYAGTEGTNPEAFLQFRHNISSASNRYAQSLGGTNSHRITPDISVPPTALQAFTSALESIIHTAGVELCMFGHVGIGALHLHIYSTHAPLNKTALTSDIFSLVQHYNGSCWSEHGIGTANAALYHTYTATKDITQWQSYKTKHDPNNILSRYSNAFDAPPG